jgi:hypothetical protein
MLRPDPNEYCFPVGLGIFLALSMFHAQGQSAAASGAVLGDTPLAEEPVWAQPPNAFGGRFHVISVATPGIGLQGIFGRHQLRTHGVEVDVIANAYEVAVAAATTMRDHDRHCFLKTLAEACRKTGWRSAKNGTVSIVMTDRFSTAGFKNRHACLPKQHS